MNRRELVRIAGLTSLAIATTQITYGSKESKMHGIIGKILAVPNKRDELIEILLDGTKDMPGCIQYIVSKDSNDDDAIWITEVWKDQESHQGSMSLPNVREAITKGKPLIANFAERHTIEPIGGQGL